MKSRLLVLTLFGACGSAWSSAGSDVHGFLLKPQVDVASLDRVADQTHGLLKWSNGAFLYMDAATSTAPSFYTLSKKGQLISTATLNVPGANQFWLGDFDRGTDGFIVFSGGTYSAYGQGAPFIAWIAPDGHTERVIRTAPYYPHMISVAPDGTVWTMGCEMIDHKADAPGLNPDAGVLRHFDNMGQLIGSYYPQSRYVAAHQTLWLQSGRLIAKNDRIAWYAPGWGHPGRYVEISLGSMAISTYQGLPVMSTQAKIGRLALTDDGTASLSVNDPEAPRHWINYIFNRAISKWLLADVLVDGTPTPQLVGSDADQLVMVRGQSATLFDVSH